jgi:hypothetical protein
MGGVCRAHGEDRNDYKDFIGKPEGKTQLRIPMHRWEDNIKIYLREIGFEGMDLIDLAEDRDRFLVIVNMALNLTDPKRGRIYSLAERIISLSIRVMLYGVIYKIPFGEIKSEVGNLSYPTKSCRTMRKTEI